MLKNKIAIVTGGAGGIGQCIVRRLSDEGATVIIHYNKSHEKASELCQELVSNGREADIYQCDIRDNKKVEEMIKYVHEKYGKIDILVNNAGVALDARIHKMPEAYFDETMAVNVKGAWNGTQHVLPIMMEQGSGAIINISSVAGTRGNIGQSGYASSKAAVIGMTKTIAREGAAKGVRANAVAPGYIEVGMSEQIPDKLKDMLIDEIPLGRPGKGKEIAAAVAFLASEDAGYITGQVIEVNGGMNM